MTRPYARAAKGQRAVGKVPRGRWERLTVIGALALDGLVASRGVAAATGTAVFLAFTEEVLVPALHDRPDALVVMDNLGAHKAEAVRGALDRAGLAHRYLPSHSPELVWGFACQALIAAAPPIRLLGGVRPVGDRGRRSEGSPLQGADQRATTLYPVGPRPGRTMMQPCASAAGLRGGGPTLNHGAGAMFGDGLPPPRIVIGGPPRTRGPAPKLFARLLLPGGGSPGRTEDDALRRLAGGHQPPQRDQQLPRQRHDHGLARAAAGVRGARPVPPGEVAVSLEAQEAPGELEHAAAHPGVAHPGQALLPPPGPALVRRAGQPGVARQRLAVPQLAREHLAHQHVRRLDADPDRPGQQADHRVRPVLGGLLQPPEACRLDLRDLVAHEPQAGHVAAQLGERVRRQRRAL